MRRALLLLLCAVAALAAESPSSTTEAAKTSVPTTPPTPGAAKKVTPTPETSKPDATAPFIVHAEGTPTATARSAFAHPLSQDARPFRPSAPLMLARSDSFTGAEPVYDVQLASTLDNEMQPSDKSPVLVALGGPITSYTTPYPYSPHPQAKQHLFPYQFIPQHTQQLPQRPRRQHFSRPPPPSRRVPLEGGGLRRPVRMPPRPHGPPPRPQRPHLIYSKPPPEVIYYGNEPPPLDYEPPSYRRPPPPKAYFSKPVPHEDEQDIMNILDHYIPDDEPKPIIRKESKSSSPLSSMMMPMMLTGLIMPLFGMMFTYLAKRRRRRDVSQVERAPEDVDFFLEMLQGAVEKMEKKRA